MKQRLSWAVVALLLALVVDAFRFLSVVGFSNDHYMHMAAGQQIAMGEWPSRDYVELGLPLMEALSAIPFLVLPDAPLFGEALLVAAMFGLAAVFTFYAARRVTGSWWIALLIVALQVVIFPRTYSYPKVLAYAAGFLAMWRYVEQPSRVVELAIAVVVAFGLRHDHGLYLGIGALLTVIMTAAPEGRTEALRRVAIFAGAVLLLLAPYIVYVAIHDGFWRHLVRGIELQAVESSRGRTVPDFTLGSELLSSNAVPWLFYVFHLLPIAVTCVAWLRWRWHGDGVEWSIVMPLTVVAVLANFGLIRDTLDARLPDAVVPGSLLPGWLLATATQLRPSPAKTLMRLATATIVTITVASATAVGATKEQLERAEMLGGLTRLWEQFHSRAAQLHERFPASQMPSRVTARLVPFLKYVDRCLAPRDYILIPAFAPELSVWARRPFAGGQVWFQAELLESDDDHRYVMSRLQDQRVPVTMLVHPPSQKLLAKFPELRQYLDTSFTERIAFDGDSDDRAIVGFNPRLAVGRDHETGWHCYR